MANVVIEVEEAEGQKEKGDHPKGKRLQHWLGPHQPRPKPLALPDADRSQFA